MMRPLFRTLEKSMDIEKTNDISQYPYNIYSTGYSFSTIIKSYGLTPSMKNDVTVGIIELGGGYLISDLEKCMIANGFPDWKAEDHVFPYFIDGYPTNIEQNFYNDLNSSTEVELDIEFVTNCIPNGRVNVYFAPNTFSGDGFINAVRQAINDNCTTISISWGSSELESTNNFIFTFEEVFKLASSKGISIFCSSGDYGDTTIFTPQIQNNIAGYQVGYPSSSPNVVCCGGTTLSLKLKDGSYSEYGKETAWSEVLYSGQNSIIVAGNSGLSMLFDKPKYQKKLNFKSNFNTNSNRRGTPDIAGNASVYNGCQVYFNGNIYLLGGVSCVSPFWAGFTAGLGCNVFLTPYLYKLPKKCFHDINSGINYPYETIKGYDLCTGLGSPNGKILKKELLKIFKKKECK